MTCDVCGKEAMTHWVMGDFCAEHEDSLRAAFFAYRTAGGYPHLFRHSAEQAAAVQALKDS